MDTPEVTRPVQPLHWRDKAWPREIIMGDRRMRLSKRVSRWRSGEWRGYGSTRPITAPYVRHRDGYGYLYQMLTLTEAQALAPPWCLPKHLRVEKGL